MGTVAQVPWAVATEVDSGVWTGAVVVTGRAWPASWLAQAVRPVTARATPASSDPHTDGRTAAARSAPARSR